MFGLESPNYSSSRFTLPFVADVLLRPFALTLGRGLRFHLEIYSTVIETTSKAPTGCSFEQMIPRWKTSSEVAL